MASQDQSTIAQLLYPDVQALDFARIVAELEGVLQRMRGKDVEILWDCDDLVTFDVPETRILLSWSETEKRGVAGCLTVSVGPNPAAMSTEGNPEHDVLCSRLVERIQGRFVPSSVLWHQVAGPVGSEVVDDLVDALPEVGGGNLPPINSILDTLSRADLHMAGLQSKPPHPRSIRTPELSRMAMSPGLFAALDEARPDLAEVVNMKPSPKRPLRSPVDMADQFAMPDFAEAANDQPDLPLPNNVELARVREALYPEPASETAASEGAAYSTQMRLAAHCMNATLILVWAPLGAAVMTYSVLRGENMRLSSRLMAVAGTLFALAHSPVGQTVAAMAKGLA